MIETLIRNHGYVLVVVGWGNGYRATLEKGRLSLYVGFGDTPESAITDLRASRNEDFPPMIQPAESPATGGQVAGEGE